MREHSPAHVQVKAAGGVRTLDALLEVRAVGVTRVGASRTAEMLDECRKRLGDFVASLFSQRGQLIGGRKGQRGGVQAVSQAGRLRPVVKDMAQVAVATGADISERIMP